MEYEKDYEERYYLLCQTRSTPQAAMWWAKNSMGYVTSLDKAQLYTYEEAREIEDKADDVRMYRADYARRMAEPVVLVASLEQGFIS